MPGEWLSRALLLDPMAIPGDSACWADARELGMAEKTVKAHVSSILGKLGVSDRTQAALYAVRAGLVGGEGS